MKTNNLNYKEAKRERFVRIAERRVNRILDDFDSLGKCANKRNYDYSEHDVRRIFGAIQEKLKGTRLLYTEANTSKNRFSLKR